MYRLAEAEFSEARDKGQEYLDNRKGDLSSLATDVSENTRQGQIEESVVRRSVEKQALEDQGQRQQDISRQKEDLEELRRQYRSRLFDEEDLQYLKQSVFKGPDTRTISANKRVVQHHRLVRICVINLSVFQFPYLMVIKDCMKVGKRLSWHVWTRCPLHQSTNCFSYVYTYLATHERSWNLCDTAATYETAKERLERTFGNKRRQIASHLEELENVKPLRPGNARDLDRLTDLLHVNVVNIKGAGQHEQLGDGSPRTSVCARH